MSACVGAVISQHGPQALLNAVRALSLSLSNKLLCVGATAPRAAELSPATEEEARVTHSPTTAQRRAFRAPTFAPVLSLLIYYATILARRRASPGRWHYCWRSRYTATRELDLARHGRYAVHSHRHSRHLAGPPGGWGPAGALTKSAASQPRLLRLPAWGRLRSHLEPWCLSRDPPRRPLRASHAGRPPPPQRISFLRALAAVRSLTLRVRSPTPRSALATWQA